MNHNSCKLHVAKEETAERTVNKRKTLLELYKVIERQIDNRDPYPLNIAELKNVFYYGYGNDKIRPKAWKIFLNYTAINKFKSIAYVSERRQCYKMYLKKSLEMKNIDNSLLNDDVNRKLFFPYDEGKIEDIKSCKFLDALTHKKITNREVIKRILTTFKATNSSIGYVQGMCNILFPIYYVFVNSEDDEDVMYAEEDAYFCFFNLMTEIGDLFVQKMDNDKLLGINSKLDAVFDIVKMVDPKLYDHMIKLHIKESAFHFRWVSLLLTYEFTLSECIYLWDRFLSDCHRFEMVIYCCSTIILSLRGVLINADYCKCLEILQNHSKLDAQQIIIESDILRKKLYKEKSK